MHLLSCQPQTVYKRGKIEIDYFDKFSCLHLTWSGGLSRETYCTVLETMLSLSHRYQAQFWIFDAREEDILQLQDPEWTIDFYTRKVPNTRVRKIARLASGNSRNEINLSHFVTKMLEGRNLPLQFRYMPDTNHALEWFTEE